ncbi:hypothetical protein ANN_26735 [Periplaneta americana]|uniref:Uncharacterized protein n=1 Tax=Periplaneta americana TaxID=6978 RepID=A0ABQ8RZK3_PERAM|nr:hypothetical protein ANN_26735 [Periplaneta americana]
MSPCDYDLFTEVKEPLRGTRYNTRDELIRAKGRSIRNINKDGRADGVRRLPNIWQKVINKVGENIKVKTRRILKRNETINLYKNISTDENPKITMVRPHSTSRTDEFPQENNGKESKIAKDRTVRPVPAPTPTRALDAGELVLPDIAAAKHVASTSGLPRSTAAISAATSIIELSQRQCLHFIVLQHNTPYIMMAKFETEQDMRELETRVQLKKPLTYERRKKLSDVEQELEELKLVYHDQEKSVNLLKIEREAATEEIIKWQVATINKLKKRDGAINILKVWSFIQHREFGV